ncbi:MAG: Gfo/Idh/MocA family oxidoreductase [Pyrinomonadaceae bacterium]
MRHLRRGFLDSLPISRLERAKGIKCVAIYNRSRPKAEAIAEEFGIPAVYDDAEELLRREKIDFIDNITEIGGHKPLVLLAATHRVPIICQKPMASSLADAREMVAACREAGSLFLVHENWRWQAPIRAVKKILASGVIGTPIRARIDMISGFEGWVNQPSLRELDQFILTDLGAHILDVARFFFGEAASLYCVTKRTLADTLRGENVATVVMEMGEAKTTVVCEMAYAKTPLERECFPQTLVFIEGEEGSLELCQDYWVRLSTRAGTHCVRHTPKRYPWADPAYDIVHASIVDCNANLLAALRDEAQAETTGDDNYKTMNLVFSSYDSSRAGNVIKFG